MTTTVQVLANALLFPGFLLLSGCGLFSDAPGTISYDSEQQHNEVLHLNDKQIFENLARAKNGQALLVSNISNVTQEMTTILQATVSSGRTITNSTFPGKSAMATVDPQVSPVPTAMATTVGSATAVAQTALRPFSYSANPERDHTIQLQQDPVYGNDVPYKAYRAFLSLNGPGGASSNTVVISKIKSVQKSAVPPPKADVCFPLGGAWKWPGDGNYYWVPKEYQADFFALAIAVVANHPDPKAPVPSASSAIVKAVKENTATLKRMSDQ